MCTNILVTVDSATTATATSCFATHRVDGHTPGTLVAPGPPANVGHYEDAFRRIDGSWLLATRTLVLAFGGPTRRLGRPDGS